MLILGYGIMLPLRWVLGTDLFQSSGSFFSSTSWKFGTGFGLTILAGIFLSAHFPNAKGLIITALSPIHLLLNARSLFLTVFVSGLLTSISIRIASIRARVATGIALTLIATFSLPIAETVYGEMTSSGLFGQDAAEKYKAQTQIDGGIVLGGRPESLISFQAIADSPFFGHGSWAENIDYRIRYFEALEDAGKTVHWSALHKSLLIPGHSHILGAWIEHGIFGAVFWLFILLLITRALYSSVLGLYQVVFIEMLILTKAIWDIPFSPFGLHGRLTMSISIVVAIYIIENCKAADKSRGQNV